MALHVHSILTNNLLRLIFGGRGATCKGFMHCDHPARTSVCTDLAKHQSLSMFRRPGLNLHLGITNGRFGHSEILEIQRKRALLKQAIELAVT